MPRFYWRKQNTTFSQPLYDTKITTPSLHVRYDGQVYYGDLEPGPPSQNGMAFQYGGQTYRFRDRADIPAGRYSLDEFVDMLKTDYLIDGVYRQLVSPIRDQIFEKQSGQEVIRHRNVDTIRWITSSGQYNHVVYIDGEFSKMRTNWSSPTPISAWDYMPGGSYTNNWVANSNYEIEILDDIIFV